VLDHAAIDELIARKKEWRELAQQRWTMGRKNHATIVRRRWQDITEKTMSDLHALARVLLGTTVEFKLVVSLNQGYVYTNDLVLLDQLESMPELAYKSYTQAQVARPKNTIQLRNSRYQFRSYFGMCKLTDEQKHVLKQFLITQSQHVRLGPALARWVNQSFTRTQDYFFVDHNTETWLTLLALVQPGIVRKTMHIITDK
jgi:hypothetical protein